MLLLHSNKKLIQYYSIFLKYFLILVEKNDTMSNLTLLFLMSKIVIIVISTVHDVIRHDQKYS